FLGYILINGDKAEVEEGIQLLNEHDSPYAHHSLALHYLPDRNGHGGDLEKAVHHLKLAADKGNEDAMYRLAFVLEGGGIYAEVEDADEAAFWLLRAIDNGNEDALPEMQSNVKNW